MICKESGNEKSKLYLRSQSSRCQARLRQLAVAQLLSPKGPAAVAVVRREEEQQSVIVLLAVGFQLVLRSLVR